MSATGRRWRVKPRAPEQALAGAPYPPLVQHLLWHRGVRTTEEILRMAFTQINSLVFPAPAWMLGVEELDQRDVDHAAVLATLHRETVEALESAEEKVAYLGGVLDAQAMLEAELRGGCG